MTTRNLTFSRAVTIAKTDTWASTMQTSTLHELSKMLDRRLQLLFTRLHRISVVLVAFRLIKRKLYRIPSKFHTVWSPLCYVVYCIH